MQPETFTFHLYIQLHLEVFMQLVADAAHFWHTYDLLRQKNKSLKQNKIPRISSQVVIYLVFWKWNGVYMINAVSWSMFFFVYWFFYFLILLVHPWFAHVLCLCSAFFSDLVLVIVSSSAYLSVSQMSSAASHHLITCSLSLLLTSSAIPALLRGFQCSLFIVYCQILQKQPK